MCIAVYKPENVKFPSKETLKECFNNNNDGAGFMYAANGKVHIKKGYKTFKSFWKGLSRTINKRGDEIPYVLHFRISTQAGVRDDCTHPFPLSSNMDDLRKLYFDSDIGIAHNGIISLTSEGWSKKITYSDTMKFITEYLSLIIKDKNYYKDNDTIKLIEKLADSKLAILDGDGHCELIGKGWIEDKGIFYSNSSYKKQSISKYGYYDWDWDEWGEWDNYDDVYNKKERENDILEDKNGYRNELEFYYDARVGKYDFDDYACPYINYYDDSYCEFCTRLNECFEDSDEYEEFCFKNEV